LLGKEEAAVGPLASSTLKHEKRDLPALFPLGEEKGLREKKSWIPLAEEEKDSTKEPLLSG